MKPSSLVDEFVPLEDLLPGALSQVEASSDRAIAIDRCEPDVPVEERSATITPAQSAEVRLFYAHLRERLDAGVREVTSAIASRIVGRELALQPADVTAIVESELECFRAASPLRVRVARADVDRFAGFDVPVAVDETLEPGDAVVELAGGTVDLRLAARISVLLGTTA